MGPKDRREMEKETLRQKILDAARELFVKEGYEKTSMRNIAKKIEYSPTTIYLYFNDKMEILEQLCEETFAKLIKGGEKIFQESDDPVVNLKKLGRAYVDFGLKYPDHYKVTFIIHPEYTYDPQKEANSMGHRCFDQIRKCVAECIRQNKFRPVDVELTSQALWANVHGITSLLIVHPDFPWANKDELIDHVIDTMCRGLRA